MSTLTNRDISSRIRMTVFQDTAETGSRGSPNAISPASDGTNYTLGAGGAGAWSLTGTIPAQEIKFTGSTSNAYALIGSGANAPNNVEALVRFSVTNNTDAAGVVLRYSSINNHYRVRYSNGNFGLVSFIAGAATTLATTTFSITGGSFYWIRAKMVGTTLIGKIWADGSSEPTAYTLQATDSNFSSGQAGLYVSLNASGHNAQFDSLAVRDAWFISQDIATRFRLQAVTNRDIGARFRLGILSPRDIASRFLLQAVANRDIGSRFLLQSTVLRDIASRFRLSILSPRDVASRFRLQMVANRDIGSRFLLQNTILRDLATRFRLQVVSSRDVASRFLLKATANRDIGSRFRLVVTPLRDIASRFRLGTGPTLRDIASRFRLGSLTPRDVASRFRLQVTNKWDIKSRFRLQGQPLRDLASRFRLQLGTLRDIGTRFRLIALGAVQVQRDIASRLRVALSQDTLQTGSRGSGQTGHANVLSPASDSETYTLNGGGSGVWGLSGTAPNQVATWTGNASANAFAILGSQTTGNVDAIVRYSFSTNVNDTAGIVLRYSGVNNHYRIRQSGGTLSVVLNNGGTTTTLGTPYSFTAATGTNYWIHVKAIGPYFLVRTWADGTSEPTGSWQIITSDPANTFTSGQWGYFSSLTGSSHVTNFSYFAVWDGKGLFTNHDIGTRFRLQVKTLRDVASRFRLGVTPLRDIKTRFVLWTPPTRDIFSRLRLQAQALRDLGTRFVLVPAGYRLRDIGSRFRLRSSAPHDIGARFRLRNTTVATARDLGTRFVLWTPAPPPLQVTGALPQVAGFAAGGLVLPIVRPSNPCYAVNGTLLPTQPYLCTAPLQASSGVIPANSYFTLQFNTPDSVTQTLLTSGKTVSLTFAVFSGQLVTGQVKILSGTAGPVFLVQCTLAQDLRINVWVVQTQFL